ncbi:Flp/Fap pilin component [Caballeronia sp. SBC1]|uniref:Flp family type IVb pilin n=1 Tax=unclassified Caballeronia TaxID=2646786 RepID=UPI0013E13342|nr:MULTISPECIES: Flp family type IVb pilin [unclassified Caballeronia]QIE24183.1 Flp/Fap pilin component [Caballeronia sp. SBC2]QIN62079.1 Flp/Fap pilin component [Caballeronia sp. SBC1]
MSNFIKGFVHDERGVTAIEYAIIAGLIAVALAVSVGDVVTKLQTVFTNIVTAL